MDERGEIHSLLPPLTHKRNSIRLQILVRVSTNFSVFFFFIFFVAFSSNHLRTMLANWNTKVEKLTNLLLRTVAKQCASEPKDEVQVFPETTLDSNCHLGTTR